MIDIIQQKLRAGGSGEPEGDKSARPRRIVKDLNTEIGVFAGSNRTV